MHPEEKKRFRDKANRNRRALLKEKEQNGYLNDGQGRRYRVGVFYVLAGSDEKALDFFSWFEVEFPDDIGEPIFNLYWVLAELRNKQEEKARYRLLITMLSNLYMLPFLFHEPIKPLDIWHSSNRDQQDYLLEVEEYLDEPTENERSWIKKEYNSELFFTIRNECINTFQQLNNEHNFEKRGALLTRWRKYTGQLFEKYG